MQAIEQKTIDSFDAHNAPELIRCKDCIKRCLSDCPVHLGGSSEYETDDDWFCADGVKKDE